MFMRRTQDPLYEYQKEGCWRSHFPEMLFIWLIVFLFLYNKNGYASECKNMCVFLFVDFEGCFFLRVWYVTCAWRIAIQDQHILTFSNYAYFYYSTSASQADVAAFKAFQTAYPDFSRWFNHIASFSAEFESLPAASGAAPAAAEEDDDDLDLFASDDEVDAEAEKLKAERVAAYNERKAAKGPKPAAKSIVTMDVKPWDDETDLEAMVNYVKSITMDGLVWGAHTFIPVGFGIKKLQINCVVEDDKVSLEDLQNEIEEGEDWVQSSDIAAMQKL